MKRIFLSSAIVLFCVAAGAAESRDTLTINNPQSVTIITDGERQIINIRGRQDNPEYTYHSESALNGGSFVRASETNGWDFSLPEFQKQDAVVWERPVFDWTSARAWWYLDRVELTDTATTVYVTHYVIPRYSYKLGNEMRDNYLADGQGRKYYLHSIEGTTMGAWHHKEYNDIEHYRFHFDPMPKDTRWFNFITDEEAVGNCYNYFYVHDEAQPIEHEQPGVDWKNLPYDPKEEMPTAKLKKPLLATLHIKFLNYRHSMFGNDALPWALLPMGNDEKPKDVGGVLPIGSDHSVTISTPLDKPMPVYFSMGNIEPGGVCVLVPGQTSECLINLLSTAGDDDFACEYRGPLALTNKQLTTYGLPFNIRRSISENTEKLFPLLTPAARHIYRTITGGNDGETDE